MKNLPRALLIIGVLILAAFPASSQVGGGISQSGNVTTNDCVKWGPGPSQVQDAGATCGSGGTGNALFGTTTGNTTNDIVTLSNTTVGVKDSGVSITAIPNANVAAAPLPAPGSGATLVAPRSYYVCTTTCTMTIPVPAAGDEFCVMNDDNVSTKITLSNPGTGVQYENTARTAYGTATSGTLVSGGAAGDKICIVGRDATHYLSVSYVGTWVAS